MKKNLLLIFSLIVICQSYGQIRTRFDIKKLNGSWVSADDKKYWITIKGKVWKEYYDNKRTATLSFTVSKNIIKTKDNATGEIFKYEIRKLNNTSLELIYLERGNTFRFRKR